MAVHRGVSACVWSELGCPKLVNSRVFCNARARVHAGEYRPPAEHEAMHLTSTWGGRFPFFPLSFRNWPMHYGKLFSCKYGYVIHLGNRLRQTFFVQVRIRNPPRES
eukprot:1292672-Rhodomonas_salina.3